MCISREEPTYLHGKSSTMKNKLFLVVITLSLCSPLWGQQEEVRKVIDNMFEAMYARDTAALRACFTPGAQLLTYTYDAKHNPRARGETLHNFITSISAIGEADLEERLLGFQCMVDEGVASVWTPYEFYVDKKFSHCGVNSFQLINVQGEWKIASLADTRRRTDCPRDDEEAVIDSLINAWHHAAAVADEAEFFGRMTTDGIYIGTDATERWLRDELKEWSKKYFDREEAWSFTPLSRDIKLGAGGQIAWFDELLDTWMGVCRSTGVMVKEGNEWKIAHYQLSITLPNDKLDGFLELIGKR